MRHQNTGREVRRPAASRPAEPYSLDTSMFERPGAQPIRPQAPPADAPSPRWLSLDQVRKLQRMRRETVLAAVQNGELACERRGRIHYFRLSDVVAWEEKRLKGDATPQRLLVHPDLAGLA